MNNSREIKEDAIHTVSVIIPTYHDWNRLGKCLKALDSQTYPADLVEILIINNSPDDAPPPNLKLGSRVRLLSEVAPGSYAARNAGISAAKGEIIAFTDSDCIPEPRWIEEAVKNLCRGADRIAGRIELFSEAPTPSFADQYELLVAFNQAAYAGRGVAATANMITWRRCFNAVGYFNEALLSGGDMEWGFRAQRQGFEVHYVADCVVRHPTRSSISELFKKARRNAGGTSAVRELRNARFWILRSLLPPKSVTVIAGASHLDWPLRARLISLAYGVKLWHTLHVLLLWAKVASPERR